MLTTKLAKATDEQLPNLIRLLGTPASGKVEEQRSTMMEWMEKRRVDDGDKIINNHPYEQVKPPANVVQKEQCFGRYFSAREPYCAEKCAFAAECFDTLKRSVVQILKGGSSLTESKEGLTKEERKKIMAKDTKIAKKAAAPVAAPVKKKNTPEPEEIEEEDTIALEDEDEVEEIDEEEDEAPVKKSSKKAAPVEEDEDEEEEEEAEEVDEDDEEEDDEEEAEEVDEDEELEGSEDTEADEDEDEEEEEEEEKPAPKAKAAPAKAAPVKEAPKAKEAPKKAAEASTSVLASLTKKVVPFAPFGEGVVVKLVEEENSLKASHTAYDLVNELYAVAEEQRVTQPQFLECIQKVFSISDDKSEQAEICKGVAEELKSAGVLKLIRVKAQ